MRFQGTYREQAWQRCAAMADADGVRFTPWPHRDHFPNWSLPALEAAKCAARQGAGAFERLHLSLYRAFFQDSRNIGDPEEVIRIAGETGLDLDTFVADYRAGVGRDAVARDYEQALEEGVSAIPTVIFPETGRALVGLAPLDQYRAAAEEAAR